MQLKAALLIGLVAAGGLGVAWYTDKRKKKKFQTSIEEGSQAFVASSIENDGTEKKKEIDSIDKNDVEEDVNDPSKLSDKRRDELALAAKNRGNKYYSGKKYLKAIELYTKAIDLYPESDVKCAVYYSNRAACHANMGDYMSVISDCSAALNADPRYIKAILRRASAFEKIGDDSKSLEDFTVACFLEEFRNNSSVESADRVLKRIAAKKAKEMFSHGQAPKSLPSLPFCSAYLNSFRYNCAHILSYAVKSAYDEFFVQAVKAYHQNDWDSAVELLDKSLHLELSAEFKGAAFNMRGTFFFLMGRSEEAYSDYEKSLEFEPKCVNTLIKIACLMMEKENGQGIDQALRWFERALQIDENDADIFYHRGQVYFLVQDYTKALADYNRSIELDDEFAFSHIQRAVSLYRLGKTRESKTEFDSILAKFPHSADIHYYYGEILLDQRLIDDALMEFDKAISINCNLPLPYLNKGIIYFHLKGDLNAAIAETEKAIAVDSRCDLAYVNLAQMCVNQGKLNEAVNAYEKAVSLSRTILDAENSIMGLEAAKAQMAAIARIK